MCIFEWIRWYFLSGVFDISFGAFSGQFEGWVFDMIGSSFFDSFEHLDSTDWSLVILVYAYEFIGFFILIEDIELFFGFSLLIMIILWVYMLYIWYWLIWFLWLCVNFFHEFKDGIIFFGLYFGVGWEKAVIWFHLYFLLTE